MQIQTCPQGQVLACVDIKPATATASQASQAASQQAPSPPASKNKLAELVEKQMEAMKKMNIPLWKELTKQIEEEKLALKAVKEKKKLPQWLEVCRNPVTKELPKIHTIDGEQDLMQVVKNDKQLIIIDNMCYDIKSLFDLIQTDIPQGNVFGINPYIKAEGFILPFDKGVKELVLKQGIEKGVLPTSAKYIDHTPKSATDKEMRGTCEVRVKKTPSHWLFKGWASDGTAFPTQQYYAVSFYFPLKKTPQNPGTTAIFPYNKEAENFIYKKLIPAYDAGCIWSKKHSVTDNVQVINQNIHMVFETNQPNRWYKNKIAALEEEILKYAPAFTKN
jgi:hypothetical protein